MVVFVNLLNNSLFRNSSFFLVLFLLLLSLLSQEAHAASPYLLDRAYFSDKDNRLTIEDVTSLPFITNQPQTINRGYINYPLWVRINIKIPVKEKLALRILPTFLDDVEIYQHVNGRWEVKKVGDIYANNNFDYPITTYAVAINPLIDHSEIYIRLKTSSSAIISTDILSEKQLLESESNRNIIFGSYLTVILATLIWSLWLLYRFRQKTIFFFSLRTINEFFFVFFVIGFGGHYLFPDQPMINNKITSISILLNVLLGVLFHREFIKNEVNNRFIVRCLSVCSIADGLLIIMYLMGYHQFALKYNLIMAFFSGLVFSYIPIDYFLHKNKKFSFSIALIYGLIGPGLVIGLLPYFGLRDSAHWSQSLSIAHGIFASLLVLILVYFKALSNQLRINKMSQDFEKEKWAHNQQKQLLSMLVHEIKTPLSVIKLAVDSQLKDNEVGGYANEAVSDIDKLVNRIVECDRLENEPIKMHLSTINLNELIRELIDATDQPERFLFSQQNSTTLSADREIIKLIVNNLLENALKYALANSVIWINTETKDNRYYLSIENEVGIAGAPDSNFVFKKYYRNIKATTVPGTGLGLYLVRSVVELLKGEMTYINEDNKVIFKLWIPT